MSEPADWNSKKLDIVKNLMRDWFWRHLELRDILMSTETLRLVNELKLKAVEMTSEDLYWGKIKEDGLNMLGKLLEELWDEIW